MECIVTGIVATIAVMALSSAMFAWPSEKMMFRIPMAVGSLALLAPGAMSDIIGLGLVVASFILAKKVSSKSTVRTDAE